MRKWLRSLAETPRGYAADGRRLGLGLATAMEKQRHDQRADVTRGVEELLRNEKVAV
jgi:hypothetical protein